MFSARVIELQSAPLWKSTPNPRMNPCWVLASASQKLSPSYRTWPLAGDFRPMKCRSSVLFPQPESPMMMKTSLRWMVKERSRWMTKSP